MYESLKKEILQAFDVADRPERSLLVLDFYYWTDQYPEQMTAAELQQVKIGEWLPSDWVWRDQQNNQLLDDLNQDRMRLDWDYLIRHSGGILFFSEKHVQYYLPVWMVGTLDKLDSHYSHVYGMWNWLGLIDPLDTARAKQRLKVAQFDHMSQQQKHVTAKFLRCLMNRIAEDESLQEWYGVAVCTAYESFWKTWI